MRDLLPAHACAYHYVRVISLRTSISRSRSATIFFRRLFFLFGLAHAFDARLCQAATVLPPAIDRLGADTVLFSHIRDRLGAGLPEDRDPARRALVGT